MTVVDPTPQPERTPTHGDRLHDVRAVAAAIANSLRFNGSGYRPRHAHTDANRATVRPAPLFFGGAR